VGQALISALGGQPILGIAASSWFGGTYIVV
jgi:hypothetical protein